MERFTKAKPKYKTPTRPAVFTTAAPKADMKLIHQLADQGKPVLTPHFLANISTKDPLLVSPHDYLSALFDVDRGEKTIIFAKRASLSALQIEEVKIIP